MRKKRRQSPRKATGGKGAVGTVAPRPSTPRSTAGPGFDFEDRVAAWFLLQSLRGGKLPGVEVAATRLQMQTGSVGWEHDDILFSGTVEQGFTRHLAISCKSNEQVTNTGLPGEFVARCWRQWTKPDPNPMHRGRDSIALMTRGRNNEFMATWSDLKRDAPGADRVLAVSRMRATNKSRAILESVKGPAATVGASPTDADVVEMINRIVVQPFDFHIADSEHEREAVTQVRSLLASGDANEAAALWEELIDQARKVRLGPGTLELADLWAQLRKKFQLKEHPDFGASWERLRALTADYKGKIETALSTGAAIDRTAEVDELAGKLTGARVCVLFGDSGTGKSALVKATLDARFATAEQVWLGPDILGHATDEARRVGLGLRQRIGSVLAATARPENILVIDSAERLSSDDLLSAKALIREITAAQPGMPSEAWRVVIICQTDMWVGGQVHPLVGAAAATEYQVKPQRALVVRQALRATPRLEWLASHSEAVAALTNLRTLGWVVEASSQFQAGDTDLSFSNIADRLWARWTTSKAKVRWVLIRLAEQEANFEHSFAISELPGDVVSALDEVPEACPLSRGGPRVQFKHDLAADLARFQRLREIKDDIPQWSKLAVNPLWHGALRMLGQLLLREQVGTGTAWDAAFAKVEGDRAAAPLADQVLLDALFLDPNAEALLEARADMLLEGGGARLLRLIKRFEHVATVPYLSSGVASQVPDLGLYLEAQFRVPVYARWPAMARFLARQKERVAALASATVSSLCERWLSGTQYFIADGTDVPFRREFAELALATAREMQLIHAKHIIVIDDEEGKIYQAALAGAANLPDEVSQWALEMARRRPRHKDISNRANAYHAERAKEHAERLMSDADYRAREERKRNLPLSISSRERLPPWPLGAQGRIEKRFREAVLRSASFQALMRARPGVAGEVLLACVIEDEPERDYGSERYADRNLGVEFDSDGYPTAPWKSPFYAFLRLHPSEALGFLIQLINFCTERWIAGARTKHGPPRPAVSLTLPSGSTQNYYGNYWVFNWSQEDSNFVGQLFSALAALEQWLCDLVDAGKDPSPEIERLLSASNSVAVLGVLMNLGKRHPDLLKGPLRAFLDEQRIYGWDQRRAMNHAGSVDVLSWAHQGDFVLNAARRWNRAEYRTRSVVEVVAGIVTSDKEIGKSIVQSMIRWEAPDDEKAALEFRIMMAKLDFNNYAMVADAQAREEKLTFTLPADVAAGVSAFQQGVARDRQALTFPQQCRAALRRGYAPSDAEAEAVAALMAALAGAERINLPDDMKRAPLVAAAVLLMLRAPAWLSNRAAVEQQAQSIVQDALDEIGDDAEKVRYSSAPSHLEFVAYLAIARWLKESSPETDERVMRLVLGGDDAACQVIFGVAYNNRAALGGRWWRLLFLSVLRSGLSMLAPRYREEEEERARWQRWRRWLRTRRLSVEADASRAVQLVAVAERVERLEHKQWDGREARDGYKLRRKRRQRLQGSLDTHFLHIAFGWAIENQSAPVPEGADMDTRRDVVKALWAHQAWWLSGTSDDERSDYEPMHQFGYAVVAELARLAFVSPPEPQPGLLQPVFALGPKGHYAIGHFLSAWFGQVSADTESAAFAERWRGVIAAVVLDEQWATGGPWYYQQRLERHALGFGETTALQRLPGCEALVGSMRDHYRVWAEKRLGDDEDNVAGLCHFLSTPVAKAIRLDGLRWIAAAMEKDPDVGTWRRDRVSNAFVEFLDIVVSEHRTEALADAELREALLALVGHAVSRHLPAAQPLQERIAR